MSGSMGYGFRGMEKSLECWKIVKSMMEKFIPVLESFVDGTGRLIEEKIIRRAALQKIRFQIWTKMGYRNSITVLTSLYR